MFKMYRWDTFREHVTFNSSVLTVSTPTLASLNHRDHIILFPPLFNGGVSISIYPFRPNPPHLTSRDERHMFEIGILFSTLSSDYIISLWQSSKLWRRETFLILLSLRLHWTRPRSRGASRWRESRCKFGHQGNKLATFCLSVDLIYPSVFLLHFSWLWEKRDCNCNDQMSRLPSPHH